MKSNNNFIKGAMILGLSFFIAILLVKPVGVSTEFSVVSGIVHSSIDKEVISFNGDEYKSSNAYYNKDNGKIAEAIKNPWNYNMIFVLSIPLGSFLGYLVLRNKSKQKDVIKEECIIKSKRNLYKEYIFSFLGGFILLFGARMAGGCTSGHMMSGMMQGSVSGYVFAMFVFLTAIPTAIVIDIKNNKNN